MNILLIGSGGREHSFAWKITQSGILNQLFIAPGNGGTNECGINVSIDINDFDALEKFVYNNKIDMIVVGPEDPLVNGIYDYFNSCSLCSDVPVIGPSKEGAMLEGSKEFAKQFMNRHSIPTAKHKTVTKNNIDEGKTFLKSLKAPYVLKASGLAAGKGVLIIDDINDAEKALSDMLGGMFGKAGDTVVIEEHLNGIEVSVFVVTDGISYKILPEAKDYKRAGEGDTGLNTGGMGAVSPVPFVSEKFMEKVEKEIIIPTIEGLKKDNITYKGFIYFGLMKIEDDPYVIEYNVRMGDPEAEVVIPRIKSDIIELFEAVAFGKLKNIKIEIDERHAATVMVVSEGYPGKYQKGKEIEDIIDVKDSIVFHAGTRKMNNKLLSDGGRVLSVTSFAPTVPEALKKSYSSIEKIKFPNSYYRKDIGFDLFK